MNDADIEAIYPRKVIKIKTRDLSGLKFGEYTVYYRTTDKMRPGGVPTPMWLCKCSCGTFKSVKGGSLTSGESRSCGCHRFKFISQANGTHRLTKKGAYISWKSMMARCNDPTSDSYANYGGRGIKVCERWLDVRNFFADMGDRPVGMSIERKDNNGDYEPDNCCWATQKQQSRNKRSNRIIEVDGESMCISAWAERTGIKKGTILVRINHGWSPRDAVFTPINKHG